MLSVVVVRIDPDEWEAAAYRFVEKLSLCESGFHRRVRLFGDGLIYVSSPRLKDDQELLARCVIREGADDVGRHRRIVQPLSPEVGRPGPGRLMPAGDAEALW
jgi:hypothetical protein